MKGLTDIKRDNNLAVIRAAGDALEEGDFGRCLSITRAHPDLFPERRAAGDALEGWWTPLAAVIEMKGDRDESTGMGTGPGSQAPE